MRKIIISVLVIILVLTATMLVGCANFEKYVDIEEPNLVADAVISAQTSTKNDGNLIDGKDGSVATFTTKGSYIDIDFNKQVTFNNIVLKESTDNVDLFRIHALVDGKWEMIYEQDRILKYRMCYVENTTTSQIRIEVVELRDVVKIKELEVYNIAKKDTSDFRVTQYLTIINRDEDKNITTFDLNQVKDDEGFSGNYDVVTDVMLIGNIKLTKEGKVGFLSGITEEQFAENLTILRQIIGTRNVKIRATIFNNPYGDLKEDNALLNDKRSEINASVKAFVEKYKLDGIDYDWEYPTKGSHWKTYGQLVSDTAEYTSVSVALPPWGIKFSKDTIDDIDFVNVMTYDLFDKRGDHSNIYVGGIKGIDDLVNSGFDLDQICIGLPSYARTTNGSGDAWPEGAAFTEELGKWGNIIKDFPYVTKVDGVLQEKTCDAYLNGYAISRDKTMLALQAKIGGIMIFRARCDSPYTYEYSMHRAINDTLTAMKK